MINTTIKVFKEQDTASYMITGNGSIILKTGEGTEDHTFAGVVIKHTIFGVGHYDKTWKKEHFTPFKGTITIEIT